MAEREPNIEGIVESLGGILRTSLAVLRNRAELFVVELQEERYRLTELLALLGVALALGLMVLLLLTGVVIFLFPGEYRIWAAFGLALLYGLGIIGLARQIRNLLANEPFSESVNQMKKD